MGRKNSGINLTRVAEIIVKNISSVEDVKFTRITKGSLTYKVSSELKIKCDQKLRGRLVSAWKRKESILRTSVTLAIQRLNEDQGSITNKVEEFSRIGQCLSHGGDIYKVIDVVGDGNCLFRCFSVYLFDTEDKHAMIRKNIVSYVVKHWFKEVDILRSSCNGLSYKTRTDYKSVMQTDGEYGTDFEIAIFSKLYEINVTIFRKPGSGRDILKLQSLGDYEHMQANLNILLIGNSTCGHWVLLQSVSTENSEHFSHEGHVGDANDIYEFSEFEKPSQGSSSLQEKAQTATAREIIQGSRKALGLKPSPFSRRQDNRNICESQIHSNFASLKPQSRKIFQHKMRPCLADKENKSEGNNKRAMKSIGIVEIPALFGCHETVQIERMIRHIMLSTLKCTCRLRFYGSVRHNLQSVVSYAKCDHRERFIFRLTNLRKPVSTLHVFSSKELTQTHSPSSSGSFLRSVAVNEEKSPFSRRYSAFKVLDDEQGDLQYVPDSTHINAYSASKCKDIPDLVQMWLQEQESQDPFIRCIGTPLSVSLYTEEDLLVLSDRRNIVLHLYTTCCTVRSSLTRNILFRSLIAQYDSKHIELAHNISTVLLESVDSFLLQYRDFTARTLKRWPISKIVVIDSSLVLANCISEIWNTMTISQYLTYLYAYCTSRDDPPDNIIYIKISLGEFMNMVSNCVDMNFPKCRPFKTLLLECMALLALHRNISELDDVFQHFATLLYSFDETNACKSRLTLTDLIEKHWKQIVRIEYFHCLNKCHYNSNDPEHQMCSTDAHARSFRDSPFFKRYKTLGTLINDQVGEGCTRRKKMSKAIVTNPHYAPEFIEHVIHQWMPVIGLWSALGIELIDPDTSGPSTAIFEKRYKMSTHSIFQEEELSIGDAIRRLKKDRQFKTSVIEEYSDCEPPPGNCN